MDQIAKATTPLFFGRAKVKGFWTLHIFLGWHWTLHDTKKPKEQILLQRIFCNDVFQNLSVKLDFEATLINEKWLWICKTFLAIFSASVVQWITHSAHNQNVSGLNLVKTICKFFSKCNFSKMVPWTIFETPHFSSHLVLLLGPEELG